MSRIRKSFVQFVFLASAVVVPATTASADLDPGYSGHLTAHQVLNGLWFDGDVSWSTGVDSVVYGDAYVYKRVAPGVNVEVSQTNVSFNPVDPTNPDTKTFNGAFPNLGSGTYFVRIYFYNQGEGQGPIGDLQTVNITIP